MIASTDSLPFKPRFKKYPIGIFQWSFSDTAISTNVFVENKKRLQRIKIQKKKAVENNIFNAMVENTWKTRLTKVTLVNC
jgi:hypothetical protein